MGFTPYRLIQVSLCVSLSPFALDFPLSIPVSYFTLDFYQLTLPHLHHPCRLRARCRAPYYDSATFCISDTAVPIVYVAAWVCRRQYRLHVRLFTFPPAAHLARRIPVSYCLGLAYINPHARPHQRQASAAHFSLFACFYSCPTV